MPDGGRSVAGAAETPSIVDIPVDQADVDGNCVSGPAWPAHPAYLAKFLTLLGTKIEL